ncbi:hypothetical protein CYMTET_27126 [Cymbomonas tetramitiformis]|uniref:Uncharacterized protein n=1 Tax=Cymbomonas tetramitiformis TaxID=36881 RepID=A0AAE0KX70_9CHLO|nr:hypothetical protein CYMTET_27126 [Cymbomonas tetramitiformis]
MARNSHTQRRKTIFRSLDAPRALDSRNARATKAKKREDCVATPQTSARKRAVQFAEEPSTSSGHETVEQDGFVFKRRRQDVPSESSPERSSCALATSSPDGIDPQERVSDPLEKPAEDDGTSDASQLSTASPDVFPPYPTRMEAREPGSHESVPDGLPDDERLLRVVQSVCGVEAELVKEAYKQDEDVFVAEAVEDVLRDFQLRIEEMLIEQSLAFAKVPEVESHADRLAERKKGFQDIKQRYEREKQGWCEIEREIDAATDAIPGLQEAVQAAASSAKEEVETQNHSGRLRKACVDAHRLLALQVKGLQAVVRSAEDACLRSDRLTHEVAAEVARTDFQGLPHVDSPKNLLLNLTARSAVNV